MSAEACGHWHSGPLGQRPLANDDGRRWCMACGREMTRSEYDDFLRLHLTYLYRIKVMEAASQQVRLPPPRGIK